MKLTILSHSKPTIVDSTDYSFFVSERVIAMSFPSSGLMALYRNPIHVNIDL